MQPEPVCADAIVRDFLARSAAYLFEETRAAPRYSPRARRGARAATGALSQTCNLRRLDWRLQLTGEAKR